MLLRPGVFPPLAVPVLFSRNLEYRGEWHPAWSTPAKKAW